MREDCSTIAVMRDGPPAGEDLVPAIERELTTHLPRGACVRFDLDASFDTGWDLAAVRAEWRERLVSGLDGTHKGGVRYPVPNFLRYSPEFPAHYEKMKELKDEREGESS